MVRKDVDVDKRSEEVETKHDSSKVASTFIKYTAYIIIFFGILWFLISYIIPMIQ